jgi:hypothetical protein
MSHILLFISIFDLFTDSPSYMEQSDYYDAPIDKVLHFIRGVGLIKG